MLFFKQFLNCSDMLLSFSVASKFVIHTQIWPKLGSQLQRSQGNLNVKLSSSMCPWDLFNVKNEESFTWTNDFASSFKSFWETVYSYWKPEISLR